MRVVIVEDEPIIAQRLERQLKSVMQGLELPLDALNVFDDLDSAESYLSETPTDLLLLDLNLHGRDGFELLKQVTAQAFHTIIISAYAERAIEAFEYGVLDFIAKPFSEARLEKALSRLKNAEHSSSSAAQYLSVRKSAGIELVKVQEIDFIKADGHYSELNLTSGKTELHDKSIDKLFQLLPPNFEKIHRSYLVDFNKVQKLNIEPGGKYSLTLKSGVELPIGRSRFNDIKTKLGS